MFFHFSFAMNGGLILSTRDSFVTDKMTFSAVRAYRVF